MGKVNLERLFLSTLGSPAKLKWYLHHNIDLLNYVNVNFPKHLIVADIVFTFIPKAKRKELIGDFDKIGILNLLKKDRPELHKILITTPNALQWLEIQLENFKKRFL